MQKINLASAQSIQSVLDAATVTVFVAGREDLALRASLTFVADQASDAKRVGFALGDDPEKFIVRGGLADDEVDAVFRAAAGRRAEHTVRIAVQSWARGSGFVANASIPPAIGKELAVPMTVLGLTKVVAAVQGGAVRAYGEAAGGKPAQQVGGRRV